MPTKFADEKRGCLLFGKSFSQKERNINAKIGKNVF
jgi:hypothetical protein